MSKAKKVLCDSHEPIAVDPNARQGWADVWIRFKGRPGRVYKFAPTLMSALDVESDLEMDTLCQEENPDMNFSDDIARSRNRLEVLKSGQIVIESPWEEGIPDICTPKEYIDRAEAERMLAAFLATLGFHNVVFKWKRPKIVVMPVSFLPERLREQAA